jgi:hypothetical protein
MIGFIGISSQLQWIIALSLIYPLHNLLGHVPFSSLYSQLHSQSESYITTNGQSASLSWNNAPIWGLWPDFCYCQTAASLLMWCALSDKRTGLSFTIAAGSRHRSRSQVRVPWDSRPYFPVPDSRLPFSSPPTTRRATMEVFYPASIRDTALSVILEPLRFIQHGPHRKHRFLAITLLL